MFYPAYVHKDEKSAYGLTFPDFPGCFSAADELNELPRAAQEPVEVFFEDENDAIPTPTAPEAWAGDERFQDGYWMLIDIDLSKLSTKAVRVNISLPEQLVHQIDEHAKPTHEPFGLSGGGGQERDGSALTVTRRLERSGPNPASLQFTRAGSPPFSAS